MTHFYFAYGMNTNLDSMASRCPTAQIMGAASLEGYRFLFRRHADVELDYGSSVEGVLWEITDEDLDNLDILEGFPSYYIRSRAWVEYNNKWYVAWVYQMADQSYQDQPSWGYVDMCREGYEQNGVNTRQIDEALEHLKVNDEAVDYWGFTQV
mgnify:CR=1 FL=1